MANLFGSQASQAPPSQSFSISGLQKPQGDDKKKEEIATAAGLGSFGGLNLGADKT